MQNLPQGLDKGLWVDRVFGRGVVNGIWGGFIVFFPMHQPAAYTEYWDNAFGSYSR